MKAAEFVYHRAASVEEAVHYLERYDGEARILAGGQSLVPMLNMRLWRPSALVDINGLSGLAKIETRGDDTIVGTLVRYAEFETSPLLKERLPAVAHMARFIADRQVRNRGSIGGSLVQADPTGEMPLACVVLGARVKVVGPNSTREIQMRDFYEGSYATVLRSNEMLTEIVFPKHPQHFAFSELCRRHNDFAVLSVLVTGNRTADGRWLDVRIGLGGVHETPILLPQASAALERSSLSDDGIRAAAEASERAISPPSDMRATEEYRRHLVPIYVRRVLAELRSGRNGMLV